MKMITPIHQKMIPRIHLRNQSKICGITAKRGQSLIEYAVLVAAVTLGVMVAANVAYRAFVGQAQSIEQNEMVF